MTNNEAKYYITYSKASEIGINETLILIQKLSDIINIEIEIISKALKIVNPLLYILNDKLIIDSKNLEQLIYEIISLTKTQNNAKN